MLHLVSTSAGTSGVFVGARHGQGFVVEMTIEIPPVPLFLGPGGAARPRDREIVPVVDVKITVNPSIY